MKKVSVSLEPEHVDRLDARADSEELRSRSAAVRDIIDEHERLSNECEELRTECEALRERLESREDRIDDLEEQLARRSQLEEEVNTLAKRVDESDEPAPPFFIRWYQYFRSGEE